MSEICHHPSFRKWLIPTEMTEIKEIQFYCPLCGNLRHVNSKNENEKLTKLEWASMIVVAFILLVSMVA